MNNQQINDYILENYTIKTYKEICNDLNITYSNIRNCVYELRKAGLIGKLTKPKAIEQWYSNEVLFMLKYFNMFGSKYFQEKFNKTRAQVDYYAKILNLPDIKRIISKRDRQILYLYVKGFADAEITKILGLNVSAFFSAKYHMFKSIGVKNKKDAIKYAYDNKLIDLLLLDSELKILSNNAFYDIMSARGDYE